VFGETIESVVKQTWCSWEWIIVDDGSTDDQSKCLLADLERTDSRVRVLRFSENRGISAARNEGIRSANGVYICFLDSDDLLAPTFIEKCVWRMLSFPRLSFTKGFTTGFGAKSYLWRNGFHSRERFLIENQVTPTSLVRREAAVSVGGFDEQIRGGLEDWDFWLKLANAGYWGDTISEKLDSYRIRDNHVGRWDNLRSDSRRESYAGLFRQRYGRLWTEGFPDVSPRRGESTDFKIPEEFSRKTSKHLLFLVPHLELGGADRFNLDVIDQLSRRYGWGVSVVTTRQSDDPWADRFYALTDDIFMLHRFIPPERYWDFVCYLISTRSPSVLVLSHSELGYRWLPFLKKKFPGLPVVDIVHIVMSAWKRGGFPRMSVDCSAFIDRTITISEDLEEWMVGQGCPRDRLIVCHCNIDADFWKPIENRDRELRIKWGVPMDVPILLYPARLCEQKNPMVLPDIVAQLLKQKLRFYLLVAGDGPMRDWVQAEVCDIYPQSTRLLGAVDAVGMRELLSISTLLLLPSFEEGIALVLYEALSMKIVPVATDVGGQRELISPECGVLLPLDSDLGHSFARATIELLTHSDRRMKMGECGRQRVLDFFHIDYMGNSLNDVCVSLMRERTWSKGTLSVNDRVAISTQVMDLTTGQIAEEEWSRSAKEGNAVVLFASRVAALIRRSPLRRVFRRFEQNYGERVGRFLLRAASSARKK